MIAAWRFLLRPRCAACEASSRFVTAILVPGVQEVLLDALKSPEFDQASGSAGLLGLPTAAGSLKGGATVVRSRGAIAEASERQCPRGGIARNLEQRFDRDGPPRITGRRVRKGLGKHAARAVVIAGKDPFRCLRHCRFDERDTAAASDRRDSG